MASLDSFGAKSQLQAGGESYEIFRLDALGELNLPYTHRVLLENLLRTEDGANVTADLEIVDAAMELGLGEDAAEEAVLAQAERVRAWVARGIWLEGEGGRCESTLD